MAKIALKPQLTSVGVAALLAASALAEAPTEQAQVPPSEQAQIAQDQAQGPTGTGTDSQGALLPDQGPQQQDGGPLQGAGPLQSAGPLQGIGPLQNAGPLQSVAPLQTVAPTTVPGGLDIAAPAISSGLPPAPPNIPAGLTLTPEQVTTLSSGNATSINQLIAQLIGGGATNQQLTALVEMVLMRQPASPAASSPAVPSLAPASTTGATQPAVTGTPASPTPPVVSPPVNYVSRS